MWKKIDRYVKENEMIRPGDRIILGLSGGADSILLARYLIVLRERIGIELYALHVNHMLRGEEADRDEGFVKNFCLTYNIPLKVIRENVASLAKKDKMSLEEEGRKVRHFHLENQAISMECNKIALAHHLGDQVETMIFRMARGTGPEGLSGIEPVAGNKIRPLLSVDKREILWILSKLGQDYVEDSTNKDLEYSRNFIRHRIIPDFCQVNSAALAHMAELSQQMREQNAYVKRQMDCLFEENVVRGSMGLRMPIHFLEKCGLFERKEIYRRMIFEACGRKKDIASLHIDIVEEIYGKPVGKKRQLPYDLIVLREIDFIYVGKVLKNEQKEVESLTILKNELDERKKIVLDLMGKKRICLEILDGGIEKIEKNNCIKYFDYDRIKSDLYVRSRQVGDYFIMDQTGNRKMLKRYFIDEKIPADKRDKMLLLTEESHILWILGGRISEAYKITKETKKILKITLVEM